MLTAILITGCGVAYSLCRNPADCFPTYEVPGLDEPSGLAASLRNPGVFWTHNDSGDEARIFAVTVDGKLLGEFSVGGADAVDWEAITIDGNGRLYIADMGNNFNNREDLVIYVVPEPEVDPVTPGVGGALTVEYAIPFHYPDQGGFPEVDNENFDAEAIFWANEKLYVLTKHRSDFETTLYRFDDLAPSESKAISRISTFDVGGEDRPFGGRVTGADATPDGQRLAVLTYHAVFVFEKPVAGDDYLSRLVNRIDFDQETTGQVEAIAWDDANLVLTNEQGLIFRLENPLAPRTSLFPEPVPQ